MAQQIKVGTLIKVQSKGHWMNGEWGIVKWNNGDEYGVAPWDGKDMELLFYRNELRVPRKTTAPKWVLECEAFSAIRVDTR